MPRLAFPHAITHTQRKVGSGGGGKNRYGLEELAGLSQGICASGTELRNTYLAMENRILRQQITGRMQLSDSDRRVLAGIGKELGKKALEEIATVAQPDTILAWHRKGTDQQGDPSAPHKSVGRPRMD